MQRNAELIMEIKPNGFIERRYVEDMADISSNFAAPRN
jgi:hypothetical protein